MCQLVTVFDRPGVGEVPWSLFLLDLSFVVAASVTYHTSLGPLGLGALKGIPKKSTCRPRGPH